MEVYCMSKISVKVTSLIDADGLMKPQSLLYKDEEYLVDRILSVRPLNSLKSGGDGEGYCFKCVISGYAVSLIYNNVVQRWQMELSAA